MNKTASNIFAMGIVASALASCGGGDSPSVCTPEMHPVTCAAISNGSGPLFSTAPSHITLDAGADATYNLSGGSGPFTATSGNTNVARATVSGTTLQITAVSPGTTQVVVVDKIGSRINLSVTVLAQGSGGTPLSLTPGNLTLGNCTTRVPFIFTGGLPPYTVFSSEIYVPVSSPLALPDGRHYFFADIHYAAVPEDKVGDATLTVLDRESRSAVALVTVPLDPFRPCVPLSLFQATPESANFRTSEILVIQLLGGSPRAENPVSFSDPGVVELLGTTTNTVTVRAVSRVRSTTLMTVAAADGQRTSVVLTVLPQP